MDRLKLKWRIFAFLLVFCALLLLILWCFQTMFLSDMYKFIRKGEIENAIVEVRRNIDSPNLQAIIRELELDKEIHVTPTIDFAPQPGKEQDARGRPMPETITQTMEFVLQGGQTISLTFHAMVSPVEATISTLKAQLYLITAVMICLSVVLAAIISKRISKPIEDINNSAKTLVGNYDTYFNGRGFLEIKELSDTLNRAASELSKVDSLRRELMANISHDLRTPLALIYSYAEMMQDFPEEVTPENTRLIMEETQRLTTLVNDILDISRLETGMTLCRAKYNITKSIGETTVRMAALVQKDGYTLIFEHDTEVFVEADEVKITQAVYNLLVNAIHYGGDKVLVRQKVLDGWVRIEVVDSGEGISPENLPFIWDRYYKIDKKHKRPITGTGLGLSIVRKIIELHEGRCGVESEVDKGSVFWFMLGLS